MVRKDTAKVMPVVKSAAIAALYTALSVVLQPVSFGPVQLRISEALCVLILYTECAGPGLVIGCVITNLFSPYGIIDVICGAAATLLAVLFSRLFRNRYLKLFQFVWTNALTVAFVIGYTSDLMSLYWLNVLSVGLGEAVSVFVFGLITDRFIKNSPQLTDLLRD